MSAEAAHLIVLAERITSARCRTQCAKLAAEQAIDLTADSNAVVRVLDDVTDTLTAIATELHMLGLGHPRHVTGVPLRGAA